MILIRPRNTASKREIRREVVATKTVVFLISKLVVIAITHHPTPNTSRKEKAVNVLEVKQLEATLCVVV